MDTIVTQWYVNKWPGILKFSLVNVYDHIYQVTPTAEPLQLNDHNIKRVIDKRVKLGQHNRKRTQTRG